MCITEEDVRKMLYLTLRVEYGNLDDCSILNETVVEDLVSALRLALAPSCMPPNCNVTDTQV